MILRQLSIRRRWIRSAFRPKCSRIVTLCCWNHPMQIKQLQKRIMRTRRIPQSSSPTDSREDSGMCIGQRMIHALPNGVRRSTAFSRSPPCPSPARCLTLRINALRRPRSPPQPPKLISPWPCGRTGPSGARLRIPRGRPAPSGGSARRFRIERGLASPARSPLIAGERLWRLR